MASYEAIDILVIYKPRGRAETGRSEFNSEQIGIITCEWAGYYRGFPYCIEVQEICHEIVI